MGLSTHQTFLTPDADKRKQNVELTKNQIEIAARLGIPTMRVNTGTWGTSGSFDELMANKGVEPPVEGSHRRGRVQVVHRRPGRVRRRRRRRPG